MSHQQHISRAKAGAAVAASLAVGFFVGRHGLNSTQQAVPSGDKWLAPTDNPRTQRFSGSVDHLREELRRTRDALIRNDSESALMSFASSVEILKARQIVATPEREETLRIGRELFDALKSAIQQDPSRAELFRCFDILVTDFGFKTNREIYRLNYRESLDRVRLLLNDSSWKETMMELHEARTWAQRGELFTDKEFSDLLAAVKRTHPAEAKRFDALQKHITSIEKLENSLSSSTANEVLTYLYRTVSSASYGDEYYTRDYFGAALILFDSLELTEQSRMRPLIGAIGRDILSIVNGAHHNSANPREVEDINVRFKMIESEDKEPHNKLSGTNP